MFEHLDDSQPPEGVAAYDAVLAAASARRRRNTLFAGGGAAGVIAAVVVTLVLVSSPGGDATLVTGPASADSVARDELPLVPASPSATATATPTHSTAAAPKPSGRAVAAVGEPSQTPSAEPSPSSLPPAPPPCPPVSRQDSPPAASAAAFEQKIEGPWRLCDQTSIFGTHEDGLEIRADHTWSKLQRDDDGTYHRMAGTKDFGNWEVLDTAEMNGADSPQRWQLNLAFKDGSYVITQPQFWGEAPQMHMNNNGVYAADYLPLSAGAVVG